MLRSRQRNPQGKDIAHDKEVCTFGSENAVTIIELSLYLSEYDLQTSPPRHNFLKSLV